MSGRRWTDLEDEQIQWLAERQFGTAAIGRIIKRSTSSVYLRAAILGIDIQRRLGARYHPLTDSSSWDEADRLCAVANIPLPLARLVVETAHRNNLAVKEARSSCRRQDHFKCRAEIAQVARQKGYSYEVIGRAINRDHTTVIHALKVHNQSPESTGSIPLGGRELAYKLAA